MGRNKKNIEDLKIKISISLDRKIYNMIKGDKTKPSQIIEKLLISYYHGKNL